MTKYAILACGLTLWAASDVLAQDTNASSDHLGACVEAANTCQVDRDEGHLLRAREKMVFCANDACPIDIRRECAQLLKELDQWLPSIILHVVDADGRDVTDVSVKLDGAPLVIDGRPLKIDPGTYEVGVFRGESELTHEALFVAGGELRRAVTIALPGAPSVVATLPSASPIATPTRTREGFVVPTPAWILGGVAVLALGNFTVFGTLAQNEHSDLQRSCQQVCSASDVQPSKTHALVADISLATALAAVATGVVWTALSQGKRRDNVQAAIVPTQQGVLGTVQGRF